MSHRSIGLSGQTGGKPTPRDAGETSADDWIAHLQWDFGTLAHWHQSWPAAVWNGHSRSTTVQLRSIDGTGNNRDESALNAAGATFARIGPAHFADGISELRTGPNPRVTSNIVVGEGDANTPNPEGLSAFMYAWGQFIDHDLTRFRSDGTNRVDVAVPAGDPVFANGSIIPLTRAVIDPTTGPGTARPATAINTTTSWLDASMIYGDTPALAAGLRQADGHLRTSDSGNLPIADGMFLAGDPRAAENFALTSLHTLFLREHNYQVDRLQAAHPRWSGDQLYEHARAIVTAEIAHITYSEFLPALLGSDAIPAYTGYHRDVDPRLTLEFNIAFRFGHSIVSAETESLTEQGAVVHGSERQLRDIFFAQATEFLTSGGAAGQLRHLAADPSQAMDVRIVEDLRNFLSDPPVSMDLAAINIQRELDFGVGTLNEVRLSLGLHRYTDFSQITSDPGTLAALRTAFGDDVDTIDFWTGGLAEDHAPGAFVGETFQSVIAAQFAALRDGDRFWYENQGFDNRALQQIERTTLADIIRRNTDTRHIQDDVFVSYERVSGLAGGVVAEDTSHNLLVVGSDGWDTLIGGTADDYLFAGTGTQVLTGGEGADRFVFQPGRTNAHITDFEPSVDIIEIEFDHRLGWNDVHIRGDRHGNSIVMVGDDRIELTGVQPRELDRYDFVLDPWQ